MRRKKGERDVKYSHLYNWEGKNFYYFSPPFSLIGHFFGSTTDTLLLATFQATSNALHTPSSVHFLGDLQWFVVNTSIDLFPGEKKFTQVVGLKGAKRFL